MDNSWIENMRQISIQAVEAGRPCDVLLGTVVSESPLAVQTDQRIRLSAPQLLVPRYLTDHVVQMSIPGTGDGPVTVKNALKTGDQVLLIQKRGAQQYLIIDRYQEGG